MSAHEHNGVLEGVRWEVWEITPDGDEWEWYAETDDLESAKHCAFMLEHSEWRIVKVTREIDAGTGPEGEQ